MARTVPGRLRQVGFWLTLAGLGLAAGFLSQTPAAEAVLFGRQMLVWDGLSYFFSWIALLTLIFVVLLSARYQAYEGLRLSSYFALLLIAGVGLIFLASANDFLMIFLSIELIGVPSFILAGYLRHEQRSSEAAIKFFLIGAFSSAMLAYGISILYGITGTTSLTELQSHLDVLQAAGPLAILALIFVLVSFGFKIALVPFHMWVPDVFEGAPAPIAAFLSVAPKVAGGAIALRVFGLMMPAADLGVLNVLAVISVLTMTIGNIIGLQQTNVIRLLAYSSIAHMGYLLLGVIGGGMLGVTGVYLYAWIYLFMNLGAFGVVIIVSNAVGSTTLPAYAGLAKRSPMLAALLTLFLVSLAGLPPTAGFVAKFYVFAAAFQSGWKWLVLAGALNSVISVGYYFKILHAMYFQSPSSTAPIALGTSERVTLAATSFFTLFLGLFPGLFLSCVQGLSIVKP